MPATILPTCAAPSVSLADIGMKRTFTKDGRPYVIAASGSPIQLLTIGFTGDHTGMTLDHPRIIARRYRIMEFKHETPSGRKYWTARPGCEWTVAIRSSACVLDLDACWLSYPAFRIDGHLVRLNVSGGTTGEGSWTDWIRWSAGTAVNMTMASLHAILAQAVAIEELIANGYATVDGIGPNPYPADEDAWEVERQVAEAVSALRPAAWVKPGMRLVLKPGVSARDGRPLGDVLVQQVDGRHKRLTATDGTRTITASYACCDWIATATANGVSANLPPSCNRLLAAIPLAA